MTLSKLDTTFALYDELEQELGAEYSFDDLMGAAGSILRLSKKHEEIDASFKEQSHRGYYYSRDVCEMIDDNNNSFLCLWREHKGMAHLYE
jgi:hypothetical protein